jgi:plastocyanin
MHWSKPKSFTVGLICTTILIGSALSVSLLSSLMLFSVKPAFGDGLTQETLSASFGNRKADLLIKMWPPTVTTETIQQQGQTPVIQFKLFDSNTNQGIKHVTYFITIDKGDKKLLANTFHDHSGDLHLEMKPMNTSQITVNGDQDPILNAYTGTPENPVIASGPIFLQGGLYHFKVQISTIDFDRTLIPDNQQPTYDGWLSVGNTQNQNIVINGKQIPIKIISYYDKLNDFSFNNKDMQMKLVMPFDWNLNRLNKVKIFVHEEISIPKPSEFTSKASYSGAVNSIDVTKNLVLDNSDPQKDVIHFMLPKDTVMKIADQVNKNGQASNPLMTFTLKPGGAAKEASSSMRGMMTMPSDSSGTNSDGNSTPSTVTPSASASVSIVKGASSPSISKPYDPSPLAIKAGTSVTWTNNDSSFHTVTSGLPEQGEVGTLFDSSIISPGKTFTHEFDKAGTFDYSCTLHPFMHGQIIAK